MRSAAKNGNIRQSILGFDHAKLYVRDGVATANKLQEYYALEPVFQPDLLAEAPEPGSFVLGAGSLRIAVIAAPPRSRIGDQVFRHGDTLGDVALRVEDLSAAFDHAVRNGARAVTEPHRIDTEGPPVWSATVGTPADLVHTLVQRQDTLAAGLPMTGIQGIDHAAIAVGREELDAWVAYYKSVFGFTVTHEEVTATGLSGMRSKVLENSTRTVKFPLVEPAPGLKLSQIDDFLSNHRGPGVQHLAMLCADICRTVQDLVDRGVRFLDVPGPYYDALLERVGPLGDRLDQLRDSHVLMDRDEWGDLLQTFSKPVTHPPTLFFEFVQRAGGRGFGSRNIRALFEAMEREQAARAGW